MVKPWGDIYSAGCLRGGAVRLIHRVGRSWGPVVFGPTTSTTFMPLCKLAEPTVFYMFFALLFSIPSICVPSVSSIVVPNVCQMKAWCRLGLMLMFDIVWYLFAVRFGIFPDQSLAFSVIRVE